MSTKALLVGINKYPDRRDRLNGCVNDVTEVRDMLTSVYRLSGENIRILLDGQANPGQYQVWSEMAGGA